jgi:hypothetical protein
MDMDISDSTALGWLACVFCVVFTLRCAFAFARKQPDIFVALMVYAGVWGVLIVYYSEPRDARSELLPALSGYLAAVSASLIVRRHFKRSEQESHHVFYREQLVAWLLLLLAVPKAVHTNVGHDLLPGVKESDLQILVTLILDTIGVYSMYKAIEISQPDKRLRTVLTAPIVAYWIANAIYAFWWADFRISLRVEPKMPWSFLVVFAVLKIAAVLTYVPAVVAAYEPFRSLSWAERAMHLIIHGGEAEP